MKKFIPIFLYLIFACASTVVKNQLLISDPNFLSDKNLNQCLQLVLWLPIGLLGGSALLLIPREVLSWLSDIKNTLIGDQTLIRADSFRILKIRFCGACFVAFTLLGMFFSSARKACEIALGFAP